MSTINCHIAFIKLYSLFLRIPLDTYAFPFSCLFFFYSLSIFSSRYIVYRIIILSFSFSSILLCRLYSSRLSSFLLLFKLQFILTFFFPLRYCLQSSSRFPPSHCFFFSVSNTDTSFPFATLKLCKEGYDGYLRAYSLQPNSCFPLSSLLYFFLFASSSFVLLCLW